ALVTPDAGLARRVAAKLVRWGVAATPSAGLSLRETPLGLLLLLLADLAVDDSEPRALAALAGNGRVGLGLSTSERAAAVSAVIDQLRGPRRAHTLAALIESAAPLAVQALSAIATALAPIKAVLAGEEVDLSRLAQALADASEAIAACPEDPGGAQVWAGSQGAAAVRALRALAAEGDALDAVAPDDAPRALGALIGSAAVAPEGPEHPRLAIWGPLEARLQRRDLIVLAGLNEGVWPAPPPDDPFLSRAMRADLGLVSPDVRIGLAAHDFAQLACAPEVLLTRAKRANGAPTVASRWLWRLETLAAGAGVADRLDPQTDWLALARALDAPVARAPAPPPKPKPPVSARPKSLRVTQIETLIRDPYAIYAGVILRLSPKDAVGVAAGPRERGTAIHEALETFSREVDPRAEDAPAQLLVLVDAALERAGFTRDARQIDGARLQRAAEAFAQWAAARANAGGSVFIEAPGRLDLGDGYFLRCRADRIESDRTGAWTIVDYKTGAASSAKQVSIGLAPQLPLEAAILDAGGFEGEARGRATSLLYWRFGGADPGVVDVSGPDPAGLADQTRANVRALFDAYAKPNQPYLCKPRAQFVKERADFDALARRKEWADAEGAQ
ncbi:MAG: PD-(D/E)XK nuclease family protein, partial [Caulobacterales bacterium]